MIPIYAPPKKYRDEVIPPAVIPPGTGGGLGHSKHNSLFDGTSVWIANTGGASVFKYDISTLQFQEFPTNSFKTTGIAFDGTHIYTTGFSSSQITKLALDGTIVGTLPTGTAGNHQIIYDSQTDALFYTAFWTGSVVKYSKTGEVIQTNAVGRKPLGIVALGDFIYVSCFDFSTYVEGVGRVVKLEKTTLNKVGDFVIGDNPSDITTDGTNLWVSSLKGGYIYKVNPAIGAILATYNTGIPDTYQTTIRHIGNGFNVLAVTVTQDYQPANITGTYNKVHFLKESDGSSLLVADAQGIDLRNGSIDSSNWVWFGGYADGSVTRILLETPNTPPTTTYPSSILFLLLHLDNSITNLGNLGSPDIYGAAPTYVEGTFNSAALLPHNSQLVLWGVPPAQYSEYTLRFRYKTSEFPCQIVGNIGAATFLQIQEDGSVICPAFNNYVIPNLLLTRNTTYAISIEKYGGGSGIFFNGARVAFIPAADFGYAELTFWVGYGSNPAAQVTLEEIAFFNIALTHQAASYVVEDSPFTII